MNGEELNPDNVQHDSSESKYRKIVGKEMGQFNLNNF